MLEFFKWVKKQLISKKQRRSTYTNSENLQEHRKTRLKTKAGGNRGAPSVAKKNAEILEDTSIRALQAEAY